MKARSRAKRKRSLQARSNSFWRNANPRTGRTGTPPAELRVETGWKEDQRVVDRLDFDKGTGFFPASKGVNSQSAAREQLRQPVKVVDSADHPANDKLLIFYRGIAMLGEESAITMGDHFHFKSAGLEGFRVKALEHLRQNLLWPFPHGQYPLAQSCRTGSAQNPTAAAPFPGRANWKYSRMEGL